jgi:hypothetical protein
MRLRDAVALGLLAASSVLAASGTGRAAPPPSGGPSASARARASATASAPSAAPSATAPSDDDESLPAGHPPAEGGNPHAGASGGGMPGMFQPPEDVEQPDPSLPPGTIVVALRDADDKPVAGEQVTLGILVNSVAKGDSRKHLQGTTDARGETTFSSLDLASNVAYRVSAGYQGGAFAAMPFQLQQAKAMRVVLHVYPVTHDVQQALVVAEATVAAEIREDRIQVEEALTIYNLGKTAWIPDGVTLSFPAGYTAFNAEMSMSDQGVDDQGGTLRLRGTYPPGRHGVEFRWQLPWSGDKDVDFGVGLPPHVAIARVMLPAASDIKLVADGFPPAEVRRDQQGQSFLVTERRIRPDEPKLTTLTIGIHDLPTPGPGRLFAALIAACGVAVGVVLAFGQRSRNAAARDVKTGQKAILEELLALERGHASGEVGPKTYERARRELIDALARTLVKS